MTAENANRAVGLPIDAVTPEILRALGSGHLVLAAPPGSGKTTGVPPALLDADWLAGRKIVMLEPRRPAARMAARRIAELLGEPLGRRVGYQIRFEREIGAATRIEIVTEGVLTRRLQQDPELSDVGLVIFDEFHERNLQSDLALALCLDVCAGLREDLRLLVMSATLADDRVDRLLGARRLSASDRSHPVDTHYLPEPRRGRGREIGSAHDTTAQIAGLVERAFSAGRGDVLVFLPGRREIEHLGRELSARRVAADLLPLYGELSSEAQDRVLRPVAAERRRIILATDIAETSLTIPGVECVVDSGLARKPFFDPNTGLTHLRTVRIARDSAAQRAGRAGRTAPGLCLRAWPESDQSRLASRTAAEIEQADLAPLALELARWGVADPNALRWPDPPPAAHWAQAVGLLQRLEALDDRGRLTGIGRRMAELPVHPRLARMLIEAEGRDQYPLACDLAALLNESDPLRDLDVDRYGVDLIARLEALERWRGGVTPAGLNPGRLGSVERVSAQLRVLRRAGPTPPAGAPVSPGGLVSLAYPDRIAQRAASAARFRLASGRQVSLPEQDRLARLEWLVVPQLEGGRRAARAWLAAPLTGDELLELHGHRLRSASSPDWHPATGAARLRRERWLDALRVEVEYDDGVTAETVLEMLLDELERRGLEALNWTAAARQLQARSELYRRLLQPPDWPNLSDDWLRGHLRDWLADWLTGVRSLRELEAADLLEVFRNLLGWHRLQSLERSMPVEFVTPAGTRRAIRYDRGHAPVLEVRMQELYGLSETPRLAEGRLDLVLHLLSPANRVLQITQDLGHFWDRPYAEVRKEMRGRYPKHFWPEDPRTAPAMAGPKKIPIRKKRH